MQALKFEKSDISGVLEVAFPDCQSHDFSLTIAPFVRLGSKLGGSLTQSVGVGIKDGAWVRVAMPESFGVDQWIPDNVVLVNRVWFCGEYLGIEAVVSPSCEFTPEMLPAQT